MKMLSIEDQTIFSPCNQHAAGSQIIAVFAFYIYNTKYYYIIYKILFANASRLISNPCQNYNGIYAIIVSTIVGCKSSKNGRGRELLYPIA